jgi:two-component system cell cycle response regulator
VRPARILVIDDNAMNQTLVSYLLTSAGCEVVAADHGEQALAVLAKQARIDAILCDIQMPVMDGHEFAQRVKATPAWRDIPMVAISARAMVGDRDRILASGFDGYLSKPIEPSKFLATLKTLIPSLGADHELPAPVPAPAPLPPPAIGTTVLVLDDTPANLQLKRDLLVPLGYRVVTADNPDDAMRLAKTERPQLIISDVGMHVGSGFDFIEMVKADPELRAVPFLFLSATHWDESARARGLALGATRYLRRPIESETLLREIRDCLGEPP